MEANEISELKEQAEQGGENAMRPVAFFMSVIAVLVAITTVLGHRAETRAVLKRAEASDVWNEYQAKKNRAYDTALITDVLTVATVSDKDAAAKIAKGYASHQEKWADDLKEEQKEALGLEDEVKLAENKAKFFDLAETLLEIGLVVSSVTLLTRSRMYWYLGIAASIVGVTSVVWGLLIK
jgi:DNA-binding transcriptional regulator YbjK